MIIKRWKERKHVIKHKTKIDTEPCYFALKIRHTNKERIGNGGFVKKSISLKLINGGPSKVQGVEKDRKIDKHGGCLFHT